MHCRSVGMSDKQIEASTSEYIMECEEIFPRVEHVLKLLTTEPPTRERLDLVYREIHTVKGSSQLFGFTQIADVAHAMENCLEPLRKAVASPTPVLAEALFRALDAMEFMVVALRANEPTDTSVLVANVIGQLNKADPSTAELAPIETPKPVVVAAAPVAVEAVAHAPATGNPAAVEANDSSTVRVSVPLLDKLMTLMGEMVLVRNQVLQFSSRSDDLEFANLSQRLDIVTSEIQGEVMKTRMQPIGNVVAKFQRVVRELSRELGKKIELAFSGMDTELDRTLLEAIKDPVMHIVRNSCDHGLETPADRLAAGKNDTGTISIRAFHEGGQVVVEVSDDGRGLDAKKLIAKALEKNVLTPDRAANLTEVEAFALIFAPGFSTAAKVTNVSGRGVGMDVVRSNVEGIGGTVELRSVAGKGTKLRLKIPLTLAIVQAMIVRLGKNRFVIPQVKLVELVRVEADGEHKIEKLQGQSIYRLRGNLLPLVSLSKVLGRGEEPPKDVTNFAVLNADGVLFGLVLDEVQDTAEVVVKPLAGFLKSVSVYSGATVLGDGSVALILDVQGIAQSQNLLANSQRVVSNTTATKPRVDLQEFLLLRVNSPTVQAIPLNLVHRLEEFPLTSMELSGQHRVMRYRGSVLPLMFANELLGLPHSERVTDKLSVIVCEKSGRPYGLVVDEILDVLNTESEITAPVAESPYILGNLIEEHKIVVVLDVLRMMDTFLGETKPASPVGGTPSAPVGKRRLLFVEDTAFFRRHVGALMTKAGYELTVAEDGQEGLAILQAAPTNTFDLVLSDIEMPKMNGLQMAEAIRADGRFGNLPMIALTTKFNPAHQREGLNAGFTVYLEKLKSDELFVQLDLLLNPSTQRKAA